MPEPLTDTYLREIQDRVIAAPKGPWPVEPNEYGLPDQVGPLAFVQTWVEGELVATIEFIGHARTDVPALLGEVARQRTELRYLKHRIEQLERGSGGARHGQ